MGCQAGTSYLFKGGRDYSNGSAGFQVNMTNTPASAEVPSITFFGTEEGGQTGTLLATITTVGSRGAPQQVAANWTSTSTPSTLASALVSGLGSCSTNGNKMVGVASGSTVYLGACNASATYTISAGVVGCSCSSSNPPDFSATITTTPQTEQLPPVPGAVYDSGKVTLTVNGTQIATASYKANSTPETIASALVSAGSGNGLVTLSVSGDSLTMTAIGDGTITDYSYQINVSSSNPATFTSASFAGSPSSASRTGGTNVALYNWAISSYAPNGDVLQMTDSVMGTWSYTYDDFNRLTSGTATGGKDVGLLLTWEYDRYGNRWSQTASTAPGYNPPSGEVSAVQPELTFNGSSGVNTNRIDGWSYDAAGNLLYDQINHYTYDAEGRIAKLNGEPAYIYDAEDRRVAKTNSSGVATNIYVLGLGGEQVSELNSSGAWVHSNVFAAGGRLLASYEGPAGTDTAGYHFHLTDWLGTKRMQTFASGNQEEVCYSYPFGDGLSCTGGPDATEHHFTGKERDTESGLDYFMARYLTSDLGRFMTPDWADAPIAVP
jgi:RHS repeat-associated protein